MTFKVGDRIQVKSFKFKGTITQIDETRDDVPYTVYIVLDKTIIYQKYRLKEGWVMPSQIEPIENDDQDWADIWDQGAK